MTIHTLSDAVERYELSSCIIHSRGSLIYHGERVPYASSQLMPINSCTKSVLSALICIAMEQGRIPPPDTPITQFFPQLIADPDERKQRITLEHLLTLSPGFRWTEFGGSNSFPKMSRSADWVAYTLQQPMSDEPGAKMIYNSGASQLLAAILAQSISTSIAAFAEQQLFGPLGIAQYKWKQDPQGIHTGGFGLELTADDMLKFGLLFLHEGEHAGIQLVSEALTARATAPAIAATPPERGWYGWHWWCDRVLNLPYYYARGFGGQFIFIAPELELVVVMTREQQKRGSSPLDLFRDHIIPLLLDQTTT